MRKKVFGLLEEARTRSAKDQQTARASADIIRTKAGAASAVRRGESELALVAEFAAAKTFDQIEEALAVCWSLADRVRASSASPKTFFLTGLYRLMLLTGVAGETVEVKVKASEREAQTTTTAGFNATSEASTLEEKLAVLQGRAVN